VGFLLKRKEEGSSDMKEKEEGNGGGGGAERGKKNSNLVGPTGKGGMKGTWRLVNPQQKNAQLNLQL